MKRIAAYTFDASEKKVTFTEYAAIELKRVLLITNVTGGETYQGTIIYNPFDAAKGGTAATNVLTLEYDTDGAGMDDTDDLMVIYDDNTTGVGTELVAGALVGLMTTELNALANGSGATASAAWDNTDEGWLWGDFEVLVGTGSAMTAGATIDLYLLTAPDGTNYAGINANAFAGSFVCLAATSGRYVLRGVPLPVCLVKAHIINNSGQPLGATGNTLKVLPYRTRGVAA